MKPLKKTVSVLLTVLLTFSVFTIIPLSVSAAADTWTGLQTEINSAGTVTLAQDITAEDTDKGITIESGKSVTLDLCGHTLSRGLNQSAPPGFVIKVNSGASLTVMDSSGDHSGKITGGHSDNGGGIVNEGTLKIESGQICENVASDKGGGILNKGTLNFSGGSINDNVCGDGGGIYNDATGTVTLSGSAKIVTNKTSDKGGGGITNDGTLIISGNTEIVYNYAYTDGGGIFNNGTTTINGGKIICNNATNAGSGVYNSGTLNMQDAPYVKNNFGDDICLAQDKKITVTGAFQKGTMLGVTSAADKAVVTSGYGTYNSAAPTDYFFENGDDCSAVVQDGGEVRLNSEGIPYIDRVWENETFCVSKTIKHLRSYTTVTKDLSELSGGNWYVVKDNVTITRRIHNNGKANLLICDGASIIFDEGVRNEASMSSELNIYGQQAGTGKLQASNSGRDSALGANENNKTGTINTYGGTIDLIKNKGLYNIGSAAHSQGGVYRFYGADVRCGAIGCGDYSAIDTSAYIGIFNSTIDAALHNGAGVLDIYNSSVKGRGQIYSNASIGGYTGCTQMGDINIYNSYIKAKTQGNGAAIGSNKGCKGGNIRIINSSVEANCTKDSVYGGGSSAAIGSGSDGQGGNIEIDHSFVVAIAAIGAGIGAGKNCSGGTINIRDSIILASSSQGGAGIGGGDDGHGGNINIKDSFVHCKTESKQNMGAYSGKRFEKALYSICMELMSKMTNGNDGTGSQIAYFYAGYLSGYFLAQVFAPNHGGAGIGGGDKGDSGSIKITGGEVIAEGGKYAAGIGGGDKGGFNDITIKDSFVTARGGEYAAGIGSGNKGKKTQTITISYSFITANGGKDAAGIGGGDHSNGGTVEIESSEVTAKGNHYGSGIGGGDANDSATVWISGISTVEAQSGGSGCAAAIGKGDYLVYKPDIHVNIGDGLVVQAGKDRNNTDKYTQQSRCEAVCNNKYAKISMCDHPSSEWRCDNSDFHRKVCKECGLPFDEPEKHTYDSNNECTVCKASATMCTLTFCEKNSSSESVTATEEKPKSSYFDLPECKNVPDGMVFVCWLKESSHAFLAPGTSDLVTNDTYTAIYLPLVETQFIDSQGNLNTVKARRLNADVPFLSSGWYVADSDIDYAKTNLNVTVNGIVNLIIADGVTVNLNNQDSRSLITNGMSSDFSLYGQKDQSGMLRLMGETGGLSFKDLIMYGGKIETNKSVSSVVGIEIVRGTLNAHDLVAARYLEIGGGNVTADTLITNTLNTFGWTELTDSIRFNTIKALPNSLFFVEEGQALTDGKDVYTDEIQPEDIEGKTLTPYELHHYGDPEWLWSDDYEDAIAVFRCADDDCGNEESVDAEITVEDKPDSIVYTARVKFKGKEYTDVQTVSKHQHALQYVDAIAPTADRLDENGEIENGNIEYWYCEDCGKYFRDENCTDEITLADTVVPYLIFVDNGDEIGVKKYSGGDLAVFVPDTVPMNYPDQNLRGKTVSVINAYAFENTDIIYAAMGDKVHTIGWHAFNGCGELQAVEVGSGLDYMYSEAFHNCPELKSFTSTTRQTFEYGKYFNPFTGNTMNVTVYGYHHSSLQSKVGATARFIGLDRHSEPTWSWNSGCSKAVARFVCSDCSYHDAVTDDEIEVTHAADKTVYTAAVTVGEETYTDTKEADRTVFTAHSLSLNGSIGVNFYLDLTEEEKDRATVTFEWMVEGNEKTHTVSLKDAEKHAYGYKATCPIAVAEMTYDINAALTLDGKTYTDTYSAATYANVILSDSAFAEKYVKAENDKGNNGEKRLSDLQLLVKTMLDYGGKAQIQFDRKLSDLANKMLVTDNEESPYYYKPDAVTAEMISAGASDMTDVSAYGLRYTGATIVYLSETSLRLYYKIDDKAMFDQYVTGITFNGKKADYTVKGDEIYYELKDIAAADLDTLYSLKIGGTEYKYSVLDYVKTCLKSDRTSDNMKTLVAATYHYNQAANSYFGK